MNRNQDTQKQTPRGIKKYLREPISGLTHLFGALLALIGMIFFWIKHPLLNMKFSHMISFLIFSASLIFLYLASAAYHLIPVRESVIQKLRKLDHSAIFLFIASSYTPICIRVLKAHKGSRILIAVWICALLGIALKLFTQQNSRWLRVALYIGLSSIGVIVLPDLWKAFPVSGLLWLFGGALLYIVGSLIYALKWPNPFPNLFGFHEIWHLFVLGGTFCHFWLINQYVF